MQKLPAIPDVPDPSATAPPWRPVELSLEDLRLIDQNALQTPEPPAQVEHVPPTVEAPYVEPTTVPTASLALPVAAAAALLVAGAAVLVALSGTVLLLVVFALG